jgi:hypothetical protein
MEGPAARDLAWVEPRAAMVARRKVAVADRALEAAVCCPLRCHGEPLGRRLGRVKRKIGGEEYRVPADQPRR